MKYKKLGKTELTVSQVCMGCMGFGDPQQGQHHWTLNEEESQQIIRQGLEAGINFFDTAIAYQGGTSEQYLGKALNKYSQRKDIIVATKFLPRSDEDIAAGTSGKKHITQSINRSLNNLGMDYVDLYIYHMWDYRTPKEEILAGLNEVVQAGKARYIGISNSYAWQVAKMNAIAGAEGYPQFVTVQGHYNLIFREEEREMIPLCQEDGIGLTPYSALAAGRLSKEPGQQTKRLQEDTYAQAKYGKSQEQDQEIIKRVAAMAKDKKVSMTQISLAWLMSKVTAPIVGMTKTSQVQDAVQATEVKLSQADRAWLEEPYQPHPLVGVMAENHK